MAKTFAVLGASGNIGSKLTHQLLEAGHQVIAVARHADKLAEAASKGAHVAEGNQQDVVFLTGVLVKADAAFLLIPPHITSEDNLAYQDAMGEAMLEAIKASGIKKIVFLSSQGANLLESKIGPIRGTGRQELRLKTLTDVDVTVLRPTYFMENNLGNIHQITNGGTVYNAVPADWKMDMIATVDIATAAAKALATDIKIGFHIVDLLGPERLSPSETIAIESELLGIPAQYVQVPPAAVGEAIKGYGASDNMASLYVEMYDGLLNEGIFDKTPRTVANTTNTTYKQFLSGVLGK